MKQKPSFQCYQQDILGSVDVQMMSAEEFGCYMLILLNLYNNAGALNCDKNSLKILCRGTEISEKVLQKFYEINGTIRNHRVDEELKKQRKFSKTQAENANKRWKNRDAESMPSHQIGNAEPDAKPMPNGCSLSSSSSSSTSIKENVTNVTSKKQIIPKPRFELFPVPRTDCPPDLWNEFLEHRAKIKKPLTARGYQNLVGDLAKVPDLDLNRRIVDAIERKWQGLVFPNELNKTNSGEKQNGQIQQFNRLSEREKSANRSEEGYALVAKLRNAGQAEAHEAGPKLLGHGD
jgi:uncharacterized protein YdaU (DUF1376 family)